MSPAPWTWPKWDHQGVPCPHMVPVPHGTSLPTTRAARLGNGSARLCWSWLVAQELRGQLPPGNGCSEIFKHRATVGHRGLFHPPAGTRAGPAAPRGSSLELTSLTVGHSGQGKDSLTSASLGETPQKLPSSRLTSLLSEPQLQRHSKNSRDQYHQMINITKISSSDSASMQ